MDTSEESLSVSGKQANSEYTIDITIICMSTRIYTIYESRNSIHLKMYTIYVYQYYEY